MKIRMWDKKLGDYVQVPPAIVAHPVLGGRYTKTRPQTRAPKTKAGSKPAGKEAGS